MKILFATVELSPLAKVGGLADVAGSLPKALCQLGHDVRVVMPLHGTINRERYDLQRLSTTFTVRDLDGTLHAGDAWRYMLGEVPVDLLDLPALFDRPQIYGEADDNRRWLLFCDAALAYLEASRWTPDVLHLNEWHTAFIGSRLRDQPARPAASLPRVFTIHNLAIHGSFSEDLAQQARLTDASLSSPLAWEPWVSHSGMGQGILWSDLINTVSPTYAREILTPEYGAGLDPLLRSRQDSLNGILNGIDYDEFNPATDRRIVANYDAREFAGHAVNKGALQQQLGLQQDRGAPLIGMVTRLFYQKGADLAVDAIESTIAKGLFEFVVLGTGDQIYHDQLTALAARHPGRVAVRLAFDADLAQLIYAGSDMFLMPSRFEPCGLGQMIALRYGSVPIVRRTGGLADTVYDWDSDPQRGNGFVFEEPTAAALGAALERALATYFNPETWHRIVTRGMGEDHSWHAAAREYAALYQRAVRAASDPANPARAPLQAAKR
ncbi:MAG TPA: glycogen synthase [Dehalococcoidia bacterium]|nr:glycogen synthase [Dehalococcoidia bacterium]